MKSDYKVTRRKLVDYLPDLHNANKGTERGLQMIEDSLQQDGAGRSIVADANDRLPAGNKTLEAAVNAGFEDVIEIETSGDVLIVHKRRDWDLTDPLGKARRYAYRDNRASEVSLSWDTERLLADVNAGIDFSRMFSESELDALLASIHVDTPADKGAEVDRASELLQKWQVNRGDLWIIPSKSGKGEHRLLCGDSTNADDVARVMAGERADAVVTDPPYGISATTMTLGTGKKQFHRGEWDNERPNVSPLLAVADKVIIWGGNYFADVLPVNNDWLCWHKNNDGLSFSEFELAWTNLGLNCRMLQQHWSGEVKEHPTQKPLPVMIWCVEISEAKSVYDPFGGSGTTMVACEQLSRKCRMVELEPKYCAVILERMSAMGLEPQLAPNA